MPALPGLGTFADSFLGTYRTMHGMDMAERELEMKKAAAAAAAEKMRLDREKALAEQQALLDEQEAARELVHQTQGLEPHQITGALPGILSKSTKPIAAMKASEQYLKGIGGAQPWDLREKQRGAQEWAGWVGVHRQAPDKVTMQDVVDQAVRLGIPEAAVKLAFPEIEQQAAAMKAYYDALNRRTGEATGGITVPGAPVVPGAPAALPGRPGSTVPTAEPTHMLESGQAAIKAEEEASARYRGAQQATGLTDPISRKTFGTLEAEQARRMAEARETPLDQKLKEAKIQLDLASQELDPLKRAKMAAETVQLLVTSGYYVTGIPAEDPMHKEYQALLARGRELAKTGTNAGPMRLPGRPAPIVAPAPGAPTGGVQRWGRDPQGRPIPLR